jgi:hypothetical protein
MNSPYRSSHQLPNFLAEIAGEKAISRLVIYAVLCKQMPRVFYPILSDKSRLTA